MTHTDYVIACYAATVIVVAIMIAWIYLDSRARQRELKHLEASGIRRRSVGSKP